MNNKLEPAHMIFRQVNYHIQNSYKESTTKYHRIYNQLIVNKWII